MAKVVDFGLVDAVHVGRSATDRLDAGGAHRHAAVPVAGVADDRPRRADPRSDLYALGAVGYFLVTGHPVFEAGTIAEIIGHHLHTDPVPPSQRAGHHFPRISRRCSAVSSQTARGPAIERSRAARRVACMCARAAVDERRRRTVVALLPICRGRNRTSRCGFGPRPHRHRGHSGSADAGGEQSRRSHELRSPRSRGRLRRAA